MLPRQPTSWGALGSLRPLLFRPQLKRDPLGGCSRADVLPFLTLTLKAPRPFIAAGIDSGNEGRPS